MTLTFTDCIHARDSRRAILIKPVSKLLKKIFTLHNVNYINTKILAVSGLTRPSVVGWGGGGGGAGLNIGIVMFTDLIN